MLQKIKNGLSEKQKKLIKNLFHVFDLFYNVNIDAWLYLKYSNTLAIKSQQQRIEAQLYKECHRIEKGLSLSNLRYNFGQDAFKNILRHLQDLNEIARDSYAKQYAGSVVREYLLVHEAHEIDDSVSGLLAKIQSLSEDGLDKVGAISLSKDEIISGAKGDFSELASTRHSVRQFSDMPVNRDLLIGAAKLASNTPSVCNRQAFKVRFYTDKPKVDELLSYQNGNKAFRKEIPVVAVITADLRYFEGVGERNQAYIDGGLFAMSLVYALHYSGLGTCFLNWSVRQQHDIKFRSASTIPRNEVVITMLAVGNLKEAYKVAGSPNKPFDALCEIIE